MTSRSRLFKLIIIFGFIAIGWFTFLTRWSTELPRLATPAVLTTTSFSDDYDNLNFIDQATLHNVVWDGAGAMVFTAQTPTGESEISPTSALGSGLAALWHLNGTAQDSSGRLNGGVLVGANCTAPPKLGGSSCSFDGADDLIDIANNPYTTSAVKSSGLSLAAWVKINDLHSGGVMGGANTAGFPDYTSGLAVYGGGNFPTAQFIVNDGSFRVVQGTTAINPGAWYHLTAVIDPITNQSRLYVNGNLDATLAINRDGLAIEPNVFFLGKRVGGGYFNGQIDEAAIWGRVLAASEIQSLAAATGGGSTDGSFRSAPINSGLFSQITSNWSETAIGAATVSISTDGGNVWCVLTKGQELVSSPCLLPGVSSFKYKVDFSSSNVLQNISFNWGTVASPTGTIYLDNLFVGDCPAGNYNLLSRRCDGADGRKYDTLSEIVSVVSPGQTVLIRGGTYNGRVDIPVAKSGLSGAWVTLRGYSDEVVVLDGGGVAEMFRAVGAGWWRLENLTAKNASTCLFCLGSGAHDWVFDRVTAYNEGALSQSGEHFWVGAGAHHITFSNNVGHHGANIWAIGSGGASNVTIQDSVAYDARDDCFLTHNTSRDNTFIRTEAYRCGDSGYDVAGATRLYDVKAHDIVTGLGERSGLKLWDSQRNNPGGKIQIFGCLVYNVFADGIEISTRDSTSNGGAQGDNLVEIYNCTIADAKINVWSGWQGIERTHTSKVLVFNTISSHAQDQGEGGSLRALAINAGATLLQEKNNLWHRALGAGSEVISYLSSNYTDSQINNGTWTNQTGLGQGSTASDPLYLDLAAADFRLQSNSPAIDRGIKIVGYHCDTAGAHPGDGCREWYGVAPDIGVFEYADTTPPPTDTVPPQTITDLKLTGIYPRGQIGLNWPAPYEDNNDPTSGPATIYDIRYARTPITDSNWSQAIEATSEPVPRTPGEVEFYILPDLSPGQAYYIAMRSQDAAGNISALSNNVMATIPKKSTRGSPTRQLPTGGNKTGGDPNEALSAPISPTGEDYIF